MKGKNAKLAQDAPLPTENKEEQANYPLFFTEPHVITLDRHAKAKVRPDITLSFARHTNSIPLTAADIPEAAKHYPIVFSQTDPIIPIAIVGLENRNYFVGEQEKWMEGRYIPAYVRKYPFVFMETPGNDTLALCIDEAVLAQGSTADGKPLYENGQPSAFVNDALKFCSAYQDQHLYVREFCKALLEKELLTPQQSDITLASQRKIQLGGFRLIDFKKFKSLPEAEVSDWYKRDFLGLAYYIIQSASNWQNLLELANKNENSPKGASKW